MSNISSAVVHRDNPTTQSLAFLRSMTWTKNTYFLSDSKADQSIAAIYALLQTTYWAANRPLDVVQQIVEHSHCFSLWHDDNLIGFVRAITDYATTSWIADMVIREDYQGQQLGQWMLACVMDHPHLKGTQFALQTKDAQRFYEKMGFAQRTSLMSTAVPYL